MSFLSVFLRWMSNTENYEYPSPFPQRDKRGCSPVSMPAPHMESRPCVRETELVTLVHHNLISTLLFGFIKTLISPIH